MFENATTAQGRRRLPARDPRRERRHRHPPRRPPAARPPQRLPPRRHPPELAGPRRARRRPRPRHRHRLRSRRAFAALDRRGPLLRRHHRRRHRRPRHPLAGHAPAAADAPGAGQSEPLGGRRRSSAGGSCGASSASASRSGRRPARTAVARSGHLSGPLGRAVTELNPPLRFLEPSSGSRSRSAMRSAWAEERRRGPGRPERDQRRGRGRRSRSGSPRAPAS